MSFGRSNKHRRRLEEIAAIAEITGSLRASGAGDMPDLTDSILAQVDQRRAFTDRGVRRRVWATRGMIGASVACVALGIALLHRAMPGQLELTPRPEPLSAVIMGVSSEATTQIQRLQASVAEASETRGPRLSVMMAEVADKHCAAACNEQARMCFVGPVRPCRSAGMAAAGGTIEMQPVMDPREVLGRARVGEVPRNRLAVEPQAGIWGLSAPKPAVRVKMDGGAGFGSGFGASAAESMIP